ncbi:hypothetical protein TOTORO_01320 [Serratia phage vB_SmaS-Totoro]|nr:hypothetical protein TOTORO_01320 [Serratia phage vB_SmaS-Totoro]
MQVNDSYFVEFHPSASIQNIGTHPDYSKFKKLKSRKVKIAYVEWADGTYMTYPDNCDTVISNGVLSVATINSLHPFTVYISKIWELSCISTGGELPSKVILEIISDVSRDCLYQHHKGGLYKVISFSNMEAAKPEYVRTVTYRSVATGETFSRPLEEFAKSFTAL